MGIGLKMLDPRNTRKMLQIAKISHSLDKHMKKRCAYCDFDMGSGDEFPVVDFVKHLADKHIDCIKAEDVAGYKRLIGKVTG